MPVVSNTDPSALFSGDFWTGFAQTPTPTPVIVTYSFPTTLPPSDDSVPNFTTATINSFKAFSPAEQAQAIAAMGQWAAASGLIFVQVAPGQGDINFSNVDFRTLGTPSTDAGIGYNPFGDWNSYSKPNFTSDLTYAGDVFMNSQYQNPADGTVSLATLLHEIGHAIGLKHPTQTVDDYATGVFEDNVLSADDPTLTIMSTQVDTGNLANPSLLPLDKAAAAAIYGPAGTGQVISATTGTFSGSNSVSNWTWNADTQTLTQTAVTANDVIHGTSVNDIINAGDGTDSLFGLGGINTLNAGSGTDYLYGGQNQDTLNAGSGTDYLYAGTGTETLNGGTGTDTFYDGGGVDTIVGDGIKDTFYVSSANTTITEKNPNGDATVYSSVSFTLPQYVDTLVLSGAGLTGTANNDPNASMFGDGTQATTLIAGTGADYMVGGSGNDTLVAGPGNDELFGNGGANTFVFKSALDTHTYIGDFVEGTDKIDLSGIAAGLGHSLSFIGAGPFTGHAGQVESYVVQGSSPSNTYTYVAVDTTGSGSANFQIQIFDNGVALTAADLYLDQSPCYRAGTRIDTERGEVAVEDLVIGDLLTTTSGERKPVKWVGRRSYSGQSVLGNRQILPICFKADSLDDAVPRRDLWVSPDHAMFIDGVLIAAEDLVNGCSVVRLTAAEDVHYVHVELERHDVILAEGAWSETFVDDDSRRLFHNARDYYRLYPEESCGPALFCAPRVSDGFELEAIRSRIAVRAGLARTAYPGVSPAFHQPPPSA